MKAEEFAKLFNGREYGEELSKQDEAQLKAHGMVAVFGYSDDNVEFKGAIDDEIGAYGGALIHFTKKGHFVNDEHRQRIEELECDLEIKIDIPVNEIDAHFYPWKFNTDIPHATFDIMDDGELFCKGIVFSISDLK